MQERSAKDDAKKTSLSGDAAEPIELGVPVQASEARGRMPSDFSPEGPQTGVPESSKQVRHVEFQEQEPGPEPDKQVQHEEL